MAEHRKTLCNRDCPDTCRIVATVEDGRVVRLQGDKEHPVTQGFLCYRTNQFLHRQYSPDRLTQPLLRKDGSLEPVSWEEALEFIAEKLLRIRAESGPAAIFHYRGGGSLGMLKAVTDYFFEKLGPCTIKRGDICSGAGDAAQLSDFGVEESSDLFGLKHARHIILWGKNVYTSSPHLIPVLTSAKEAGAKVHYVDPVHTRTVSLSDTFAQPRPGADFALAMSVARLLFERGRVDAGAAKYCDNLEAFESLARSRTVAEWCRVVDVPLADAEVLAGALAERPCTILVGWGMGRRLNGATTIRALDALGAISGNLGILGGGVSYYFWRRRAFDLSFVKGLERAPRSVCEPLFGQEVLGMKDPPIRAIWVTAGNPVAMLPDSNRVAEALRTRELTVVVDSFLTDTAEQATVVLPTTTLLEEDDLLGSYGHHFIGAATPVVAPPDGVKSDLDIVRALAKRVGLGEAFSKTARDWKEAIVGPKLRAHGVSVEALERAPIRNPLADEVLFKDRKFQTPSGRVNLVTQAPPLDAATLPSHPLVLMAVSTDKSQSSQWAKPQAGPAVVTVHPRASGGVEDGGLARLESEVGALVVQVKHDAHQRGDVALMAKGGHLRDGRCANALIRARATDLGEGGALYDEPVRLVPLS